MVSKISFNGLDGFHPDIGRDNIILRRDPPQAEEECDSWEALYLKINRKNHVYLETRTCRADDSTSAAVSSGRELRYRLADAWDGSCEVNVAALIDDLRPSGALGQLIWRLVAGRKFADTSEPWDPRLTEDAQGADAEMSELLCDRDRYSTTGRVWDASSWITTEYRVRWDSTDDLLDDLVVEQIDRARWHNVIVAGSFLKVFQALREKKRKEHQSA